MKKLILCFFYLALIFSASSVDGQNRKVLVEHFTNSKCPICKNNNPGFYTRFNNYKSNAIHMAVYSEVPYSSCAIHQANVAGSNAREALYNIPGAPTVILDGKKLSSNLPSDNDYTTAIARPADYTLQYTSNSPDKVSIRITTLKNLSQEVTIQAFVALTEKQFEYTGSNGESVHYDVFRKFLKDANNGVDVTFPGGSQAGDFIEYDFGPINYSMPSANEYNLITFINKKNSLDILQSEISEIGTPAAVNKVDLEQITLLSFPNPVRDILNISWNNETFKPNNVRIFNEYGHEVSNQAVISFKNETTINLQSFSQGIYLFRLVGSDSKIGYGKFIVK